MWTTDNILNTRKALETPELYADIVKDFIRALDEIERLRVAL